MIRKCILMWVFVIGNIQDWLSRKLYGELDVQ